MTPVAVVAVVALILAAFVLGGTYALVGWIGAWRLNHTIRRIPSPEYTFTPWELEAVHERVRFETDDGIRLEGWFLARPETSRAVIAMHGYRGDMSQVLGISTLLWRAGFNVLLFDFRGRGRSADAEITMGLAETTDLAAALDWVEGRVPGARIGLFGFSMGAVVALMGGDDPRVGAIVADSAFPSQRTMLEHVASGDASRVPWLQGRWFLPAVEWWHRRMGKPGFDAIAPIERLERLSGTPLLFIHGSRDRYVTRAEADRLVAAAPEPKETWWVEGAYHCGAYFEDRGGYARRTAGFFERALQRRETGSRAVVDATGTTRAGRA